MSKTHGMRLGRRLVVMAFAVVLVANGCGKVAEKAGERIAEKATGCKNIDVSDKGAKASCDGNSVNVDNDGNVSTKDKDGNETTFGVGAELPADWPAELAPPDGTKILTTSTTSTNGKKSWLVVAAVPGDVESVSEGIKDQLAAAGFGAVNSSTNDTNGIKISTLNGQSDSLDVAVLIGDSLAVTAGKGEIPSGSTGVTFTLSQRAG